MGIDDLLKYDKVFLLCPSPFRTELFTLDDIFLKEFYKHPLDFLKKQTHLRQFLNQKK